MQNPLNEQQSPQSLNYADPGLQRLINGLSRTLERDEIVQNTTNALRDRLNVDRVVLYYFYRHWHGRVTFESLSHPVFSILGTTGPDECFNGDYATMYQLGRVRAIADIDTEPIAPCHRDFLKQMQVRANLAVPILTQGELWGLLVAHHCQSVRPWTDDDIEAMQLSATKLAESPAVLSAATE